MSIDVLSSSIAMAKQGLTFLISARERHGSDNEECQDDEHGTDENIMQLSEHGKLVGLFPSGELDHRSYHTRCHRENEERRGEVVMTDLGDHTKSITGKLSK